MRLPTSPIIEILVIQILKISGRVDSDVDNACYGLGPFVTLTVEKLPLQILFQFHDNAMTTKMAFSLSTHQI
jgi:hypothetical protein